MDITINLASPVTLIALFVVGALIAVGIAVGIVWMIRRLRHRTQDHLDTELFAMRWREVEELLASQSHSSWRQAVIEADKLVDHALKSHAIAGKDMGERLKVARYAFPHITVAWDGHRIRNNLVHDMHFKLTHGVAKHAVWSLHRALKVLGAL